MRDLLRRLPLLPQVAATKRQAAAQGEWALARRRRRSTTPALPVSAPAAQAAADLRRNGVTVLRQVVPRAGVCSLLSELDAQLDRPAVLQPVRDETARRPGYAGPVDVFLPDEVVRRGPDAYRSLTHHAVVADPLLTCPSVVAFAFTPLFAEVAQAYLGCPPGIGGVNLRRTFVNALPEADILFFHRDRNSPRFLKFFLYLHDVGPDGGGFCYIKGSQRAPLWQKDDGSRLPPAELEDRGRSILAVASAGDVVVADTTGLHRGTKPVVRDRSMLTIDLVLHPEFGGRFSAPAISGTDHLALGDATYLADFMRIQPVSPQ